MGWLQPIVIFPTILYSARFLLSSKYHISQILAAGLDIEFPHASASNSNLEYEADKQMSYCYRARKHFVFKYKIPVTHTTEVHDFITTNQTTDLQYSMEFIEKY